MTPETFMGHEALLSEIENLNTEKAMTLLVMSLLKMPALKVADLCAHAAIHWTADETGKLFDAVVAIKETARNKAMPAK